MRIVSLLCISACLSFFSSLPIVTYAQETMASIKKPILHTTSSHMLPRKHALRPILDKIFHSPRVMKNATSFAKAGFITIDIRHHNHMRVARHPELPGYLVKLFLHSESPKSKKAMNNMNFRQRCASADIIRRLITKHAITHFTVPDKWVYAPPFSKKRTGPRSLVLVVTDMNIVSYKETEKAWKTEITPEHLRELILIKRKVSLSQTIPENIPYTKEGTFAFIDTEKRTWHTQKMGQYFSTDMQTYWQTLRTQ